MWEKSGGWPARFSDILVFLNSHFFNVVNPESRFDMDWSRLYILQSPYTCFIGVDYAFSCSIVFPRFSAWKKSIHHTYKPIRSWTVDILPYNTENHISPKRTTWDRGQFLKIETVPCYLKGHKKFLTSPFFRWTWKTTKLQTHWYAILMAYCRNNLLVALAKHHISFLHLPFSKQFPFMHSSWTPNEDKMV